MSEAERDHPVFAVRKTGDKTWTEIRPDSTGALVDRTNGRVCDTDSSPSASIKLASDEAVLIGYRTGGVMRYVEVAGGGQSPTVIPVRLSADGGDDGSVSEYCTLTYTVRPIAPIGAQPIAQHVRVIGKRFVGVKYIAAGYGLYGFDEQDQPVIFWCDEQVSQYNCG